MNDRHADSHLVVEERPLTLADYHKELMHAQISGIKWIEIEEPLMKLALEEISRAVGQDMAGHRSFVQNDIRVYLKGSKEALDEHDGRPI